MKRQLTITNEAIDESGVGFITRMTAGMGAAVYFTGRGAGLGGGRDDSGD